MTIGELVTGFFSLLEDFLMHFLSLFFWETSWWNGNIFMVLIVIVAYVWVYSKIIRIFEVIWESFEHLWKYIFNSEFRNKIKEKNKLEREADQKLQKMWNDEKQQEIEKRKAELSPIGKIIYWMQRNKFITFGILYLIFYFFLLFIE